MSIKLSLTHNESVFLSDCFTLLMDPEEDEGVGYLATLRPVGGLGPLPARSGFIQEIGKAIVYTKENDCPYDANVMPLDLHLIREISDANLVIDEEKVGYNLKIKACDLLFSPALEQEALNESIERMLDKVNMAGLI